MARAQKIARGSFIASALGAVGIFIPSLLGSGTSNAGIAIASICGFVFLCALITGIVYLWMAKREQAVLQGDGVIARFTYSETEWKNFTEYEHKLDSAAKTSIAKIIAGFAAFFGLFYLFIDSENGKFVFAVMLALAIFVWFFAKYTTNAAHKNNLANKGSAIIAIDGVLMNDRFSCWNMLGAQFESITYCETASPKYIEFTWSMPTQGNRTIQNVRVPVPAAQEKEVPEILSRFS
jgi:uncharacterized membrane protein